MENRALCIRKAGMKDAAFIAEFNMKMAQETEGKALEAAAALSGAKALIKDAHKGFYLIAETRESSPRIAAQLLVTFEWSDWRNKYFWWLQSVYVDPDFRSQKVFSRLFRHLEEMARYRRDVAGLRLYVAKHNQTAKAVYETLGMIPTIYDMYEIEF